MIITTPYLAMPQRVLPSVAIDNEDQSWFSGDQHSLATTLGCSASAPNESVPYDDFGLDYPCVQVSKVKNVLAKEQDQQQSAPTGYDDDAFEDTSNLQGKGVNFDRSSGCGSGSLDYATSGASSVPTTMYFRASSSQGVDGSSMLGGSGALPKLCYNDRDDGQTAAAGCVGGPDGATHYADIPSDGNCGLDSSKNHSTNAGCAGFYRASLAHFNSGVLNAISILALILALFDTANGYPMNESFTSSVNQTEAITVTRVNYTLYYLAGLALLMLVIAVIGAIWYHWYCSGEAHQLGSPANRGSPASPSRSSPPSSVGHTGKHLPQSVASDAISSPIDKVRQELVTTVDEAKVLERECEARASKIRDLPHKTRKQRRIIRKADEAAHDRMVAEGNLLVHDTKVSLRARGLKTGTWSTRASPNQVHLTREQTPTTTTVDRATDVGSDGTTEKDPRASHLSD